MTADWQMIVVAKGGEEARSLHPSAWVAQRWIAELPRAIQHRTADVGGPCLTEVLVASFTEASAATEAARARALAAGDDTVARQVLAFCEHLAVLLAWSGGAGVATAWVLLYSADID